jgi:uncharacterized protein YneF (UPF0154 family)
MENSLFPVMLIIAILLSAAVGFFIAIGIDKIIKTLTAIKEEMVKANDTLLKINQVPKIK